jgi:hypothetical protein
MRKQLIGSVSEDLPDSPKTWLDVGEIATAEISSAVASIQEWRLA